MTQTRLALGRAAEQAAARLLEELGCALLARNQRVRYAELGVAGELDLIALDGRTLVFVEVKAARAGASRGPERPALAVTARKQLRLRRLARAWMTTASVPRRFSQIRFDVVGVTVNRDNRIIDIEHIENAF